MAADADRVLIEVIDDGGTSVLTLYRNDDLAQGGRGLRLVDPYSRA
jgi:hypothetical protein